MSRSNDNESRNEPTDARLDELEHEMLRKDSLEMAAIRRLLHGLSDSPTDTDPVAKVDAIVDRIETLEAEVYHLWAQLRSQRIQQK